MKNMFRLAFSFFIAAFIMQLVACSGPSATKTAAENNDPWLAVPAILDEIKAPEFKNREFLITNYGAIGDGKAMNTEAFSKAIDDCNRNGGGRVVVPAGNFLTGPIHLKSNVNLHVSKGATISFSTQPEDYLPLVFTRWEGVELMGFSPLIYAFEQENIAITGEGTLDGMANETNWWPWKGKTEYGYKKGDPQQEDKNKRHALFKMAEDGVPVSERKFGVGSYLRPQFIQPYRCKNVLIEGVTIVNSPMWILNPVLCNNVIIQGVTVNSHGPNNDGCNPESSKNVLIKNCYFNTGDDCIAIKSGRNADGRRINIPSENIIIQGCKMVDGHGGVVIGSEISGGVRNVFAEDCEMSSPELDRALRIKTNTARGGVIENIYMRNVNVGQVKEQLFIATMYYEDTGNYMPVVRNIEMRNVKARIGGKTGILLQGYKESPVSDIRLIDVTIDSVKTPFMFNNATNISAENVFINGMKLELDRKDY